MSAARRKAAARRPATGRFEHVLLASEGRAIPQAALLRVAELVAPGGSVRVLSVARVHGVSFGLPNPGLLPTKREWDQQREQVRSAIRALRKRGIDADGRVVGTRNAAKLICAEADAGGCEAIVMAADPDRPRLLANMLWSQEPQRVRRRAKVPVFLVRAAGG